MIHRDLEPNNVIVGAFGRAREAFEHAAAIGEQLVRAEPKNPRWASELAEVRAKLR